MLWVKLRGRLHCGPHVITTVCLVVFHRHFRPPLEVGGKLSVRWNVRPHWARAFVRRMTTPSVAPRQQKAFPNLTQGLAC